MTSEFIGDLDALKALNAKLTPAMNCVKTDLSIESCK